MRPAADMRAALEGIPVGTFILDAEGNYLYVNREYCENAGRPASFFLNTSIPRLKAEGYLTTSVWEQVVQERRTVASVIVVDTGEQVLPSLTISVPQFDDQGNITQIVCRQEPIAKLNRQLQEGARNKLKFGRGRGEDLAEHEQIIAESPQMKQLLATLQAVSRTDASILVTGPSGSGKEVLSRMIHQRSARRDGPLVTINCAAIPESLFESEMFGYERGAFTGATAGGKKGLIESANGGTLFLDEINSMPLSFQSKLLRVLETKQVTRLGSVKPQTVDFRLVCASNEDLHVLVGQQRFRSDLFYRVNVIALSIPPLNERKADIVPLAMHFTKLFCTKYDMVKILSDSAMERLKSYGWPGNIRELRNVIERAVIMSPEQEWEIRDIPLEAAGAAVPPREPLSAAGRTAAGHVPGGSLRGYMDRCERELFRGLLEDGMDPRRIAQLLRIDLSSVYRKLKLHGLEPRRDARRGGV